MSNDSKQVEAPVFMPGIAVFYDRFWSEQWLVICGICGDEGIAQPFGGDADAARRWAIIHHQQAHSDRGVEWTAR